MLDLGVCFPREGEAPAEPLPRADVFPGSRLSRRFALPVVSGSTQSSALTGHAFTVSASAERREGGSASGRLLHADILMGYQGRSPSLTRRASYWGSTVLNEIAGDDTISQGCGTGDGFR